MSIPLKAGVGWLGTKQMRTVVRYSLPDALSFEGSDPDSSKSIPSRCRKMRRGRQRHRAHAKLIVKERPAAVERTSAQTNFRDILLNKTLHRRFPSASRPEESVGSTPFLTQAKVDRPGRIRELFVENEPTIRASKLL